MEIDWTHRVMDEPAIAEDNFYNVHVMWLDQADMDKNVADHASKRYIENKRSTLMHPKGWDNIWATTVDVRIFTVQDGAYMKIPTTYKSMIITRVQSWILKDAEQGLLGPDVQLPLVAPKKRRRRVGQHKKKDPKENKRTTKKKTTGASTKISSICGQA